MMIKPDDYARNSTRTFHIMLVVLMIASMGPYVLSNFRVEHFVIYPLAAAAVLFRWRTITDRVLRTGLSVIGAWTLLLVIGVLAIQYTPAIEPQWEYSSILAGVDTLLMPLLVAVIVIGFAPRPVTVESLWLVCKVIVALGVVNGLLSLINMLIPEFSLVLRPFWGAVTTDSTVADSAMTMGRYSGIFNQPAEAGLFYSIAAVSAIVLYSNRLRMMWPTLLIITVGGMLTVSKVFLFIGLPIAVVYLFTRGTLAQRFTSFAAVAVMAMVIFYAPFLQTWSGLDYLLRFADAGQQSVLELFTAGRWNEGSTLLGVLEYIYYASPLVGVGLRGLSVPYDSAWAEIAIYAGVIGVVLMLLIYVVVFIYSSLLKEKNARSYGVVFSLILLGASFGISSLTLNRVCVLVWIVIAIILLLPKGDAHVNHFTRSHSGKHRTDARVPAAR